MSDLSPHAAEFSPRGDDYDDDFDDDSFEDDAPQQLSPISEAVPPSTPMSPPTSIWNGEFIRRWRAKRPRPTRACASSTNRGSPSTASCRRHRFRNRDRRTLPPRKPGTAGDQLLPEQVVHPSQQDESPRWQLLREKETLLEEGARARVASLENQLGDSEKRSCSWTAPVEIGSCWNHYRDAGSVLEHGTTPTLLLQHLPSPDLVETLGLVARDELDIARGVAGRRGSRARDERR